MTPKNSEIVHWTLSHLVSLSRLRERPEARTCTMSRPVTEGPCACVLSVHTSVEVSWPLVLWWKGNRIWLHLEPHLTFYYSLEIPLPGSCRMPVECSVELPHVYSRVELSTPSYPMLWEREVGTRLLN